MQLLCGLLFASGAYPLSLAWRANRQTSLAHAVLWAVAAWLMWGGVVAIAALGWDGALMPARYLALCLSGCAGVAVLGARWPGVAAWNFVLLGLLAVLLLFLAEGALVGGDVQVSPVRGLFLALVLAVGVVNYLPTRLWPAALVLGGGAAWEFFALLTPRSPDQFGLLREGAILLVPWIAWLVQRRREVVHLEADCLWRDFRDRYGLVWGQRLREQFNRAAANAGLGAELGWRGLRSVAGTALDDSVQAESLSILRALLKRFGTDEREETARRVGEPQPVSRGAH